MIYQNNYGKYKQGQQSQSSCSQCKRNVYKIQQENSQSDDNEVIPLRRQISQHNYQIQRNLAILTKQIGILKRQNQTKDKIIQQLKISIKNPNKRLEDEEQLKQINRIRQELGCSPRNTFGNSKMFSSKNINISSSKQKQYPMTNTQGNFQTTKYSSNNSQSTQLKIALLQKQIREYQLEVVQLKQRISVYEGQFQWMNKFIHSFVKMSEQLSVNYGQLLQLQTFPLKKKTKICWKYMKQLISYFIKN